MILYISLCYYCILFYVYVYNIREQYWLLVNTMIRSSCIAIIWILQTSEILFMELKQDGRTKWNLIWMILITMCCKKWFGKAYAGILPLRTR